MDIHHETLIFEKLFTAPPSRVFAAYVDKKAREKWSAPSPEAEIRIDNSDVRTGGRESGQCGGKGDLRWSLELYYHRVTPDRQITFSEELWDGDQLLVVALITFDLVETSDGGTALKLTDQITSFVGRDIVRGHQEGHLKALANLRQLVDS